MKKKVLSMLLAGAMVLGLAACGGGTKPDDSARTRHRPRPRHLQTQRSRPRPTHLLETAILQARK